MVECEPGSSLSDQLDKKVYAEDLDNQLLTLQFQQEENKNKKAASFVDQGGDFTEAFTHADDFRKKASQSFVPE